ncbi:hypothetical protein [Nocardioides sediminis]|uniref:hypothetical protein n=1 Tax=Nocardioides sediminis TaxID=433648 RepID=UPI000D3103F3|nr:hypothetical protein [Nocardioides sediminis]
MGDLSGVVARLRARRAEGHHAIWAVTGVALVVVAWGTADAGEAWPFLAPFFVAVAWGTAAVGWSLVLGKADAPARGRATGRPHPRSRRARGLAGRSRSPRRPPWAWPTVLAYAAPVAAGVALAPYVRGVDEPGTLVLLLPLALVLGWLSGVCVALLGLVVWICVIGVIGFGRPLFTGKVGGESVPRAPYVGPFVATAGLLLLPLTLVGAGAYDSPYRRDVLPLLGILRDGVEVTHPVLLTVSQLATWAMVLGLVGGFLIHRLVGSSTHARGETP